MSDKEFTRMCPVRFSADKAFLPDLDTLLSTPTGLGLSHVRMALARYVLHSRHSSLDSVALKGGSLIESDLFLVSFPL